MVWDIPESQAALYIQLSLQSICSKAFGLAGAIMSVFGCCRSYFLCQRGVQFALKSCQICYFNSIKSFTFIVSHYFMFQPETFRMRALGRLKNLECLDSVNVTDEEMTTALKMAAASRPSSFSILAHARTDQSKPRTLSLVPTAQAILANSQNKPVKLMDDDSQWFQKVTS